MKEFDVMITETLERKITVEAASKEEAERIVTDAWNHEDYVLGAEDFTGVEFKAVEERDISRQKDKMDVLLVQPNAYPQRISIGTGLDALQSAVGGDIEITYPFADKVAIVLNEEGKLLGLPLNRAARTEGGYMYDIYSGDFLVVGLTEDSFGSLTPEMMDKYEKLFHQPEMFVRMGRSIMALPLPDDMVKPAAEQTVKPSERQNIAADRDCI